MQVQDQHADGLGGGRRVAHDFSQQAKIRQAETRADLQAKIAPAGEGRANREQATNLLLGNRIIGAAKQPRRQARLTQRATGFHAKRLQHPGKPHQWPDATLAAGGRPAAAVDASHDPALHLAGVSHGEYPAAWPTDAPGRLDLAQRRSRKPRDSHAAAGFAKFLPGRCARISLPISTWLCGPAVTHKE